MRFVSWAGRIVCLSAFTLAACGNGDGGDPVAPVTDVPVSSTASAADAAVSVGSGNACPVDGCLITIKNAEKQGNEFALALESNFSPDVSLNHYHVYWDTYSAEQVSNDAAARGVKQGEWIPTADSPTFTTKDVVSTKNRGTSTKLCVTAGDRDHNVIDSTLVNCMDVSAQL